VVITGGSSGIGEIAAERLAQMCARIVLIARILFSGDAKATIWERISSGFAPSAPSFSSTSGSLRADRIRKSLGAENTFSADIFTFEAACEVLQPIIEKVWRTCEGAEIRGRTVTLKVKYADFQQITRSRTGQALFSTRAEIEQLRAARATVPGHKRHPPSRHDLVVARREATGKRAPIQPVILG
jgi:nucleotidyltransferase/DNA polymerase involved in DNA repair